MKLNPYSLVFKWLKRSYYNYYVYIEIYILQMYKIIIYESQNKHDIKNSVKQVV